MKKPGEIVDFEIKKQFTDWDEVRCPYWQWYKKANSNIDDFYHGMLKKGKILMLKQHLVC